MLFLRGKPGTGFGDDLWFAWEDQGVGGGTDSDYNDLVGQLEFTGGFAPAIPEPASFALLGLGLVGVALRSRKHLL